MSDNSFMTKNGLVVSANNTLVANSTTNKIGINKAVPTVTLDINATDSIQLPVGSSAQRGGTSNGLIRYNSDLNAFEGAANNSWIIIAQAGANNSIFSTITAGTIQFNANAYDYTLGASNSYSIFLSNTKIFGISTTSANLFSNSIYFSSGLISVGNVVISNTSTTVGNATVYSTQIQTGLTIVGSNTINITSPTTTQKDGTYYLNANGSYTQIDHSAAVGANTQIEFNDSGYRAGSTNLNYDKINNITMFANGNKLQIIGPGSNTALNCTISNDTYSTIIDSFSGPLKLNPTSNKHILLGSSNGQGSIYVLGNSAYAFFGIQMDTTLSRGSSNYGKLNFGTNGYFIWDGANYNIGSIGDLYVAGNKTLHSNNFNSYAPTLTGTGATGNWPINITGSAASVSGYIINQNLRTTDNATFSQVNSNNTLVTGNFSANTIANLSGEYLSIRASNGTSMPAAIAFNRPGVYATYFGLDTDNQLKIGGWSMGNVAYPILHANNFNSYAPTLTGTGASGTWNITANNTTYVNGFNVNQNLRTTDNVTFGTINTGVVSTTNASITTAIIGTLAGTAATGTGASGTWNINISGYQSTTNLGKTGNQVVAGNSTWTSTDWSNLPIGYASLMNSTANGLPLSQYFYFNKIANRDSLGGFGGMAINYANNDLWIGTLANTTSTINWTKQLSSNNFNSYAPTLTGTGASGTWNINITGAAAKLGMNGALTSLATFNWSGQPGQPTWVWGGSDELNHYVYNPSAFNVNNATYVNGYNVNQDLRTSDNVTFSNITVLGNLSLGQNGTTDGPTLHLKDNDGSTRYLQHNSGYIGFLGSDFNWKFYVNDSGQLWTPQMGDLATYIRTIGSNTTANRWVYVGDQPWYYSGGIMVEPYNGSAITGYQGGGGTFTAMRFRQLQYRDIDGNWQSTWYG